MSVPSFKSRFEIIWVCVLLVIPSPGLAYLFARLYYLGLMDEVTFEKVSDFDRWVFMGLIIATGLGYGLAAWYGHTHDWVITELLFLVALFHFFPLLMAWFGNIELKQDQKS